MFWCLSILGVRFQRTHDLPSSHACEGTRIGQMMAQADAAWRRRGIGEMRLRVDDAVGAARPCWNGATEQTTH
jgi:hypothetical protein